MGWLVLSLSVVAMVFVLLLTWRGLDRRSVRAAWDELANLQSRDREYFSHTMVSDQPEPVRRFFKFAIQDGAQIWRVVEIDMKGELSLGTKERPNYRPMQARQISAAPFGFIWSLCWNGIRGSDGALFRTSWTKFWLFGVIPVVWANGKDHRLSAFGRMVGDSVIWAPASMLPGEHVTWESIGLDSARATVRYGDLEQAVDISLAEDGRPLEVTFQRWSNANAEKVFRLQPFGGELSDFKLFEGYCLPTKVTAGNHFGTPDYFPFFLAEVSDVTYPSASD